MPTASGLTCQSTPLSSSNNEFLNVVFSLYLLQAAIPFYLQTRLLLPSTAMLSRPAQTLMVCVFVASPPCPTMPGVIMPLIINCVRSSLPSFILFRDCVPESFSAFPYSPAVGQHSQRQPARQEPARRVPLNPEAALGKSVYTSTVEHVELGSADICWETLPRIS